MVEVACWPACHERGQGLEDATADAHHVLAGSERIQCGDFAMMRRMLREIKTRAEWSVGPTGGESGCAG